MIEVKRIYDDVRTEGLYCGTPMTFVELGLGTEYQGCRQLLEQVVVLGRRRWVCLLGEDTTRAGIGRFFEGLRSFGFSSEAIIASTRKEPSWRTKTTSIVVSYAGKMVYDLTTLRSGDAIQFPITAPSDLKRMGPALDRLEKDPFWKFLYIDPKQKKGEDPERARLELKKMIMDAAEIANKYEKARVFWR